MNQVHILKICCPSCFVQLIKFPQKLQSFISIELEDTGEEDLWTFLCQTKSIICQTFVFAFLFS